MRIIKSKQDFEQVFHSGRRYNHPLLRAIVRERDEGDPGRVAFAAPKRIGNAVARNRSKRVLRECARACGLPLAGRDIIMFATPRTRTATPDEMVQAFESVRARAERAARRG